MARSKVDPKQFRSDVAKLKKLGLIPSNIRGHQVDARYARPSDMFQGSPLKEYISKYKEVLQGNAVVLPKDRLEDTSGYATVRKGGIKEKVIVPLSEHERVEIKDKKIKFTYQTEKGKITRVQVPRKNLKQYLSGVSELPHLKKNEYYAFNFHGGRSHGVYRDADLLAEEFMAYKSAQKAAGNPRKERYVFQHLEIVQITDREAWEAGRTTHKRKARKNPYSKVKARFDKAPEWKKAIIRKQRRESAARQRAKNKRKR